MREERKKRGEGGISLIFPAREKENAASPSLLFAPPPPPLNFFCLFPQPQKQGGEIVFLEKTLERSPPSSPQTDLGQESRREGEVIASYGKRPPRLQAIRDPLLSKQRFGVWKPRLSANILRATEVAKNRHLQIFDFNSYLYRRQE